MNSELGNLKNEWCKWIRDEKRLSENTYLAYRRDLDSFFCFLSLYFNKKIDLSITKDIDNKTIRSWFFSKLENGAVPRSNARCLSSIKSFYNFLIKKKIIDYSPILNIKSPKFKSSLPRPLSMNQINKVLEFIIKNEKRWIAKRNLSIVLLMWGVGLRINEVLDLKLKDILDRNEIIVRGKGGKERILPIIEEIKNLLFMMLESMPVSIKKDDFIFLGEKGKRLHPTIVQKEIRNIRRLLNLPENTTPHSFRHTFATQLLENMVDLRSIQELLGHKSLSSTQKYTAVDSKRVKKIIEIYHPRSSKNL
tara:strand:+ start:310 stop:1230 length:921 start_codon:yes stop_codon:yes gene_type:complete